MSPAFLATSATAVASPSHYAQTLNRPRASLSSLNPTFFIAKTQQQRLKPRGRHGRRNPNWQ